MPPTTSSYSTWMSGFSEFQRSTVSCMPGTHDVQVSVTCSPSGAGSHGALPAWSSPPPASSPPHAAAAKTMAPETAAAPSLLRLLVLVIEVVLSSGDVPLCGARRARAPSPVLRHMEAH